MSDMKTVRLAEVLSIEKGRKITPSETPTSIRYIQIEDLRGDVNMKWAEEDQQIVACDENDVLLAWDGANAGEFGYGLKGAVGSTLAKLSPRNGTTHTPYLGYFLKSKSPYLRSKCTGATIPHVNRRVLEDIEIPLPPLPTQQCISAVLDKAQALVANDRQTVALYDQLAKSLFLELFGDPVRNERGWEVVTMNEVATKVTDGEHATPRRSEKGQLLLSARNIRNRAIDLSPGVDYVEQDEFDRIYRRCNPQRGDILISCSGSIGRTTKVRTDQPIVLVRSVALVKPDHTKVDGDYLEQFLLSDYMQAMMQKSAKSSSQANLFTGPIKELPVLLPPMNEQKKWNTAIEKIDTQRAKAEQSLRQSEGLFGSLLQSAFAGGLGLIEDGLKWGSIDAC